MLLPIQGGTATEVWRPFDFFIGSWEGTGKGEPGISKVERNYERALNSKFIQVKNKSIYAPQEKNPKGEVHEDWGFVSYDRNRKLFVLRQFHVEGYVNQYTLEKVSSDGKTIIFVTETIENIPAGYRARETYKIIGDNEFIETFEIAEPGKDFMAYSENHFKRKKS